MKGVLRAVIQVGWSKGLLAPAILGQVYEGIVATGRRSAPVEWCKRTQARLPVPIRLDFAVILWSEQDSARETRLAERGRPALADTRPARRALKTALSTP